MSTILIDKCPAMFYVCFMQRWERIANRVAQETAPSQRPPTKGDIAQRLGISRPALNRRLHGEVNWHYDELELLAEMFNITVEELISGEESA